MFSDSNAILSSYLYNTMHSKDLSPAKFSAMRTKFNPLRTKLSPMSKKKNNFCHSPANPIESNGRSLTTDHLNIFSVTTGKSTKVPYILCILIGQVSEKRFQEAMDDVIKQNNKVDQDHYTEAVWHFNGEKISEGGYYISS